MEKIVEFILASLPGIVTAILAAFISSRWAFRQLLADKWWDRKEKAYSDIIDALYDLVQYTEIRKDDYGDGAGYSEQRLSELGDRYSAAIWKVKRATAIGAFLISDESAAILDELHTRSSLDWNDNPPWEVYEHDYRGYQDALKRFRHAARDDLRRGRV